ncbi:hypothetical protein [Nocardioides sp. AE5]|uniref:hypothetical protein n=1 Tax=Nocardioides sp. AE5 TaxID=2962573 RepID=UPI002881F16A|nr:hypothetical protein [Nocardioides sp. AE5]MDT0202312.1 hypothetical protein [Nocardioides sp. AE5]
MDMVAVEELQARQAGVIARRQVLALGGDDNDIERMIRRRAWARVLAGCYVDHTGHPTWEQRAWAAVLGHAPAVLAGASALVAHGLRTRSGPRSVDEALEIAVDASRCPRPAAGLRIRRIKHLDRLAQWHLGPPRIRLEPALLDVASRARDEAGAVAVLADACQQRRTTPRRLLDALATMRGLRRKKLLREILADVDSGAFSVLERRYLVQVERRHGLPSATRQRVVRTGRTTTHRDVDYRDQRTIVELDGRLGHEWSADRWADLDRDIASAVEEAITLRAGWKQVLEPCRLAMAVGAVLRARGWQGQVRGCGPGCPAAAGNSEAFPAPGAGKASA